MHIALILTAIPYIPCEQVTEPSSKKDFRKLFSEESSNSEAFIDFSGETTVNS